MHATLAELWEFTWAVFSYWQSYVTGGAIMAIVGLFEKLTGRALPRWMYLVMFLVVFLPMSFFFAWRDEHRLSAKRLAQREELAEQLEDRRRQQQKADEYGPILDHGRSVLVQWVDALAKANPPGIAEHRKAAFDWLGTTRKKIEDDFGRSVGDRFNLGKPTDVILGVSEPKEHEARLLELSKMMQEMRSGQLPLRVRRSQV